jgi:hypothetical protein
MSLVRYETIYFKRYTQTINLNTGREIEADSAETFEMRGNIQPITGEDKALLPEGRKYTDFKSIWSDPEYPLTWDMVFLIKGDEFEVFHIDDWDSPSATIPHWKAIVQRRGNGGNCDR